MIRRSLCVPLCVVLSSVVAFAQPIHGHPQKGAYASPSEWPVNSSQVHWFRPGINAMNMLAHTHNDLTCPYMAETTLTPMTCHLTITMFMTSGQVVYAVGLIYRDVVLDNNQSFPLKGNPDGVVAYTGTVVLDPGMGVKDGYVPPHGWYTSGFVVRTTYDNGDAVDNVLGIPYYSLIDPAAPDTGASAPTLYSVASGGNPADLNSLFGFSYMEVTQPMPLFGPISPDHPWTINLTGYNYVALSPALKGVVRVRLDPDLHNGIPGTFLTETPPSDPNTSVIVQETLPGLTPTTGLHKHMYQWDVTTGVGAVGVAANEELVANLVFTMNFQPTGGVDQTNPPPIIIQPPPTQTQTWTDVVTHSQQLIDSVQGPLDLIRICLGSKCTDQMVIH